MKLETPCYLYSIGQVVANHADLRAALGTKLVVSLKANSNADVINRCHPAFTDGVEVASIAELNRVVGGAGGERFVNNPSYDKDLIRAALAVKATLLVDHPAHVDAIAACAAGRVPVQPLILRLNGSALAAAVPGFPLVRKDHFGMDFAGVAAAIERARAHGLQIRGLHLFNGSFTFAKTAFAAVGAFKIIVARVEEMLGAPLSYLNVGGGFNDHWRQEGFDFAGYRAALATLPAHLTLAHESGRGVFASAGKFMTRVIYAKDLNGQRYYVCDGGLAHSFLLAGTEGTFRRYKTPSLFMAEGPREALAADALLVGSSCSKDDVIGRLPAGSPSPVPGDVLAFDNCGAYNSSYTPVRFLSLPEAREYVVA